MSDRIKNGIIVLVATSWAICVVIAPLLVRDYKADPVINVAFTTVLGVMFLTKDKEKKK